MTPVRFLRRRLWLVCLGALLSTAALSVSAGAGAARHVRAASPGANANTPGAANAAWAASTAATGPAPPSTQLDLALPLVADDAGLATFATAVSTPGSPQYGHFLSVSALTARFGARPGVAAGVIRYLRAAGARRVGLDSVGQYVSATMTVAAVQRAFGTRLARFRAAGGEQYIAPSGLAHGASAQPPLPAPLRGLVTGVVGLDTQSLAASGARSALPAPARASTPAAFAVAPAVPPPATAQPPPATAQPPPATAAPAPATAQPAPATAQPPPAAAQHAHAAAQQSPSAARHSGTASGCSGARRIASFTPNQYLTAYGYRGLHDHGLEGQGERAALIEIDGFRGSDINGFVRCFRLPYPHIGVHPVGGLRAPLAPGGETTLDLELMTAAAPRLSRIDVYESRGSAGHVLRAYSAALAPGRRPQVISASLGICEQLALDTMGRAGISAVERILRTAAASGVSVLASAGDQGSSSCVLLGRIQHRLAVSYPASSPWVTAVGGTNALLDARNHIRAQVVWNDTYLARDAGGGGASILFARPAFQAQIAVGSRAVPDVSMLADLAPGYAIFCTVKGQDCGGGGWTGAGGTSAAAPLLAGGIAIIDQDLRRHHRHDLGQLNPLLYVLGASAARGIVYDDITAINNDLGPYLRGGTHRLLGCCAAGPGYDTASGWGTVDVSALARLVLPGDS